jgi:ribosomal protein S18 acetylase RimI-like enzyme
MFRFLIFANAKFSQRVLHELPSVTGPCKAKALKRGEKFYYIFFLGTEERGRGKGLCSTLIRHYQAIAAKENFPIYMEAATEYSWNLYKKLGFETVDELPIGKGKAAANGTKLSGGPGFKIWGMIWRPDEKLKSNPF